MLHEIKRVTGFRTFKEEEYPEPASNVDYDETMTAVYKLAEQVQGYDQIVGVARSGMPYATWVAQLLGKQLGYFNPVGNIFALVGEPGSIAFIDNTSQWGGTNNDIREFMRDLHPNLDYVLGTVWIDHFHPHFNGYATNDILYGQKLSRWVENFYGFVGKCQNGEFRYRDQTK